MCTTASALSKQWTPTVLRATDAFFFRLDGPCIGVTGDVEPDDRAVNTIMRKRAVAFTVGDPAISHGLSDGITALSLGDSMHLVVTPEGFNVGVLPFFSVVFQNPYCPPLLTMSLLIAVFRSRSANCTAVPTSRQQTFMCTRYL